MLSYLYHCDQRDMSNISQVVIDELFKTLAHVFFFYFFKISLTYTIVLKIKKNEKL